MGGSKGDETESETDTDAPAWLSRAAARRGGLDALADELGADRREHVSDRGVEETLATAFDDEGDDGPETVVADHGVDEVFETIEAAAPDPDADVDVAGRHVERSDQRHPVLDPGPRPAFDDLADPDGDVEDLFETFAEDDPAEVAAAAETDDAADAGPDGDVEGVFDGLDSGPAATDRSDDGPKRESSERVATASSPMTDGDAGDAGDADETTRFEAIAADTEPAPAAILDGPDEVVGARERVGVSESDSGRPPRVRDGDRGSGVASRDAGDAVTAGVGDPAADPDPTDTASSTGRGQPESEAGAEPDALEMIVDGPEDGTSAGVIGRVWSFLGRLLP